MDKKRLYQIAYRALEHSTPLKTDCGLLCGSKCCRGSRDAGMHLYPGEEGLSERQQAFLELRQESLAGWDIVFAGCRGECNRRHRPLACRIYPLAPYLAKDGRLHIVEDPRVHYQCPLLFCRDDLEMSGLFKRHVRDVFLTLIKDPDIRAYIRVLSTVLEEYSAFTGSWLP